MNINAWQIVFRTEIAARFSLREKLLSDLFLQAFKLIVPLLTWHSLFQGREDIGGYNFKEMAIYILIMNFIGFIFSMAHGTEFAQWVKSGRLSSFLLRPVAIFNSLSAKFVARVILNVGLICGPLLFINVFLDLKMGDNFHFLSLILVLLNLCFCFLFGLLFGLSAFWLEEIWPLSHLVRALISVVGGLWFPLSLLPWGLGSVLVRTPFAHLGYLNGAALMGKLPDSEIKQAIVLALFWIALAGTCYGFVLKLGLRKYEAVGA